MSSLDTTQHNQYLPGHNKNATKAHEWRNAINSAAHLLPRLEEQVKRDPQLSLLDVGAGSGTITASLAKYMPRGRVVALDLSKDVLLRAAQYAQSQAVHNVETQQGTVYELPFEDSTFDIVHASMVLTHLDDPAKAISEMTRVAKKPGGTIALSESILDSFKYYPEFPSLLSFSRMLCSVHSANGAHIDTGAQLVKFAMEAGVTRAQIEAGAGAWCYSTPEERAMWSSAMIDRIEHGQVTKKALESGLVTKDTIQEMVHDFNKWNDAKDGWVACLNGSLIITL